MAYVDTGTEAVNNDNVTTVKIDRTTRTHERTETELLLIIASPLVLNFD